jgi:hypothetical protein
VPLALGIVGVGLGDGGAGSVVRAPELVHALAVDHREVLLETGTTTPISARRSLTRVSSRFQRAQVSDLAFVLKELVPAW